jgi:hypothetical protein
MAKKNLSGALDIITGASDPKTTEPAEVVTPGNNVTKEETRGRKKSNDVYREADGVSKSKVGLRKGSTRATFILDEKLLKDLKTIALINDTTLKSVVDKALTDYVEAYKANNSNDNSITLKL